MTETTTALVTGASSGIGLAAASLLLERGYRVVGISRRNAAEQINLDRFESVSLDLSKPQSVDSTLDGLTARFEFDCLVHAAGSGQFGSIEQFSTAQIEASLRVNLTSAMLLARALVPGMRRRGRGQLIFIGSESGLTAGRKGALYCAAKFGLRGFCQSLSADCRADGIRVSLINPGMVRSPFFDDLDFRPAANPENAIEADDMARVIAQILDASSDIVMDEINLSPRIKSIDFQRR